MFFPFLKNATLSGRLIQLIVPFLLLGHFTVKAGGLLIPTGAREAGMGRCSVALTGFWGIRNNQAGMALIKDFSVGINYESRFGMDQLSTKSLAALYPSRWGVVGMSMDYFGYSLYHEIRLGLAYARIFGSYLRVGVQLDYFHTAFGNNYGRSNNLTFELGLQSDLTDALTLGAYVFNPVPKKESAYAPIVFPMVFRLGIAYHFSKNLLITFETEKNSNFHYWLFRGGMEYVFREQFFFRAGLGTQQEIFSIGFGYKLKGLSFDLAATLHEALGVSPQVSLIYSFGP